MDIIKKLKTFIFSNWIILIKSLLTIIFLVLIIIFAKSSIVNYKSYIINKSFTDITYNIFLIFYLSILVIASILIFYNSHKAKQHNYITNKYSKVLNISVAFLIFSSGVLLLISAMFPRILSRLKLASQLFPIELLQLSQRLSILIGIILIVVSKEVLFRVKRSYTATIYLLIIGCAFTLMKGLNFEEAIFILATLSLTILSKSSFYRESIPIKRGSVALVSIFSIIFITLYLRVSHKVNLLFTHKHSFKLFTNYKDFIATGAISYILFIIFLLSWYYRRKKIEDTTIYSTFDEDKLATFLTSNTGNSLTHLIFLKDKRLFWANDDKVLFAYSKFKDKIVVLGEPLGDEKHLAKGLEEFQTYLDLFGYTPIFYQVSDKTLSLFHDYGYYFFKLGEEAIINLENFNLNGSKKSNFRNTINKFHKNNFTFEVINPPHSTIILNELSNISDEWLENRKEKGFSLGWFDINYLQKSPLCLVKDNLGNIIAFTSIMPNYDNETISLDLMRFKNNTPNSTMDFLIINILLYYKEIDFKYFNFGMAPLANVGNTSKSHFEEKVAKLVFNYGDYFYSFTGLRNYKEKFSPTWKPQYLAYSNLFSLPEILLDISLLVANSKNNTIK